MTQKDELASLKARVAELERAKPQPPLSEQDAAAWRGEMHQLREQNANAVPPWMRDAVAGGVTDADAQGIGRRDCRAPTGPSSGGAIPSSQQISAVRGTGWRNVPDFGADGQHPTPGVAAADRLMDAQDAIDRQKLIAERGALK